MSGETQSLKPLKGEPRQHEFMALDTEDDGRGWGRNRGFYLGCVRTPAGARTFESKGRLLRFLGQERWGGYWCAAHNLEYDAMNLWTPRELADMQPVFSGSKMVSLKLRVANGEKRNCFVYLFDTTAFMPQSLKTLAPLVNLEKLDMDHDGTRNVTRKKLEYNIRDTEIVWKLAYYIQDGVNALGAQMKLTAASTALDLWRRKFQREAVPCLEDDMQKTLHRGYYGGRVEAFRLGDYAERLFGNDFNGMYVSVMVDSCLPEIGTFAPRRTPDLTREGMLHGRIAVPEHLWAGPLPVKGDKLTFPVGRLEGHWTYSEVRAALNYGCRLDKVFKCWHSTRDGAYLSDMCKALRAIRENPDTPACVSQLAKLLGNSAYGKFAQRNEDSEYWTLTDFDLATRSGTLPDDIDFDATVVYDSVGLVKLVRPASFPAHSNVIWSACITAGARNRLYPHLDEASTYYCDTDSVIGRREYPATKTLGQLAIKEKYSRLVIRGNKLYAGQLAEATKDADAGDWESHAKGIPRDRALDAVLKPGEKITSRRPVKFRTALRGKARQNEWIEVYKRLSMDYDKRTVNADGSTRPLIRKDW